MSTVLMSKIYYWTVSHSVQRYLCVNKLYILSARWTKRTFRTRKWNLLCLL